MTEASKQIFWLDEMQLNVFGWNDSSSRIGCTSTYKDFIGQAFTMMLWYKCSSFSKSNEFFSIQTGTSNENGFTMIVDASGQYVGCQQNKSMLYTKYMLTTNVWHHLAFTRDSSGTTIKGYVDGQLIHTGTYAAQAGLPNTIACPASAYVSAELAKVQLNDAEFTLEEMQHDMNNLKLLQHVDTLRAAYLCGVVDGVLIDYCKSYDINVGNMIDNRGQFML